MAIQKITTGSLADDAVTAAKIAAGTIVDTDIGDDAITTAKILDANVTDAKIDTMSSSKLTGALPAIDGSALTSLTSGNLTGALPAIDGSALTGLPAPAELSTASGSAPSYSARAWVNFNGTGAVAIRDSGNVSSITDNGVGDYTVNFTTAMQDANYSAIVSSSSYSTSTNSASPGIKGTVAGGASNKTTSAISVLSYAGNGLYDFAEFNASIFR